MGDETVRASWFSGDDRHSVMLAAERIDDGMGILHGRVGGLPAFRLDICGKLLPGIVRRRTGSACRRQKGSCDDKADFIPAHWPGPHVRTIGIRHSCASIIDYLRL
jgi:hypothetical protein